jgi:hypothetical protein
MLALYFIRLKVHKSFRLMFELARLILVSTAVAVLKTGAFAWSFVFCGRNIKKAFFVCTLGGFDEKG